MADSRDNTKTFKRLKWKALKTLGDVHRGIRAVTLKAYAGRMDKDDARNVLTGLSKLGDLYTKRLERKRAQPTDADRDEETNVSSPSDWEQVEAAAERH